jgi:uncharacterized membrane protein
MKQNRLKIRPPKKVADRYLEAVAIIALIAGIILVAQAWSGLPANIPTHFNARGKADGWGSRNMIWLLPAINIVLVPALLILRRFPWASNMPIEITEKNAEYQYGLIIRLLSLLAVMVSLLFFVLVGDTIAVAVGGFSLFGWGFMPIFLVGIIAPIFWYLIASYRGS